MEEKMEFINRMILSLPALLIALTFHELAHGYVSYLLGDPTAKSQGRLSLNPIAHIDPIGFASLLFFRFGWAKPVPIDPRYYKNRKLGTILVSLAGPATNFLLAIITGLFLKFSYQFELEIIYANDIISAIIGNLLIYNITLGVFNLIPIPPLDGSKILASLLPIKYEIKFYQLERYSMVLLIVMMYFGIFSKILNPLVNSAIGIFVKTIFL